MNTFFTRLAGAALLLVALPTNAITISLNPATSTTTAGSSVDVALVISGLGAGAAPSLGVFDLDIGYNPAILNFSSVIFGDPILGDQLDLSGLGSLNSFTPGTGSVNLFELSLDAATDLNALQADSFTLATLTFSELSAGVSPLNMSLNAIGDANGDPLTVDSVGASVTVNPNTNPGSVPEPAAWILIGLGVLTMQRFTRLLSKINF
jgi:hypothetical protein